VNKVAESVSPSELRWVRIADAWWLHPEGERRLSSPHQSATGPAGLMVHGDRDDPRIWQAIPKMVK